MNNKIFNRENLLVLLIVGLIGHNIYIQTEIEKAIDLSGEAKNEASEAVQNSANAAHFAEEASRYSRDASDYASEASDYAKNASNYARNASEYAEEAASKVFGNECWECP